MHINKNIHGWIFIDKPVGWSSFDVVKFIRGILNVKIGHCGTLDPFASGLLVLALGHTTKSVDRIMKLYKRYTFTVEWGIETDTLDISGKIIRRKSLVPSGDAVTSALSQFQGFIDQKPPQYSAIKINGIRSYKYARKGLNVFLASRRVQVLDLKNIKNKENFSTFEVTCSKGFYVRSLARDISEALGTCCYVKDLRRHLYGYPYVSKMVSLTRVKDSLQKKENCDYLYDNILPQDLIFQSI